MSTIAEVSRIWPISPPDLVNRCRTRKRKKRIPDKLQLGEKGFLQQNSVQSKHSYAHMRKLNRFKLSSLQICITQTFLKDLLRHISGWLQNSSVLLLMVMRVEWWRGKNLSLFLLLQSNVRGEELIENSIRDGVVMINPSRKRSQHPNTKCLLVVAAAVSAFQPLGEFVLVNDRAAGKM